MTVAFALAWDDIGSDQGSGHEVEGKKTKQNTKDLSCIFRQNRYNLPMNWMWEVRVGREKSQSRWLLSRTSHWLYPLYQLFFLLSFPWKADQKHNNLSDREVLAVLLDSVCLVLCTFKHYAFCSVVLKNITSCVFCFSVPFTPTVRRLPQSHSNATHTMGALQQPTGWAIPPPATKTVGLDYTYLYSYVFRYCS